MITGNFEQVSATQTELWCKLNHQIEPKSNKGKCEAKRHDANNATNQGAIGRTERILLKGYDLRTNYAKNTTNVTFCDLEQVTSSIQTKNVYKKNNASIASQLVYQSRWYKNQNEVKQNSNFRCNNSEQAAEIWPSVSKLNWVVIKQQMHTN